jgi:peptidoglycan hydrolase-like protein with peptidoglycan-binding domain
MDRLTIAFSRASRRAQIAFAFYAGHGVQVDGINYLIPTDVQIEDEADLRRLFRLNNMISDAAQAAKLGVVAVDACRDNPFIGQDTADASTAGQTRSLAALAGGLAAPQPEPHTLVVYATAATSTAEDGLGRNSPFTAALLKDLEEPADVRFVFGKVVEDVARATQGHQRPNKWDALGGEQVSLVRPEAVAQALEAKLVPVERSAIQRSLVRLRLLARAEDGTAFGPNVRGAIRSFQAGRGDPATGYLTVDEMVALHADARSHGAPLPLPKFDYDDLQQRALADNPDAAAMRQMGMLYDRAYEASNSVAKRMSIAVIWYRKAATAGDVGAALDLARILVNGSDGVPPNATEAVRWLKMAASAGQADGQYELARLVRDGNGVPKNPDEAVRLFRLAMKNGSGEAAAELRAMRVPVETQVSGR